MKTKDLIQKYIDAGVETGDRWSKGIRHHPKSIELMTHLAALDFELYGDYFGWKMGGDGDNGETLMYQMDAYFELKDKEK